MENKLFMASCPICGRSLFKGKADSYVEGGCPKCKNYLKISFADDGVRVIHAVQEEKQNLSLPKR